MARRIGMNIQLHELGFRINSIDIGHGEPRSRERFAYIYIYAVQDKDDWITA